MCIYECNNNEKRGYESERVVRRVIQKGLKILPQNKLKHSWMLRLEDYKFQDILGLKNKRTKALSMAHTIRGVRTQDHLV